MRIQSPPTPRCFDSSESYREWLMLARGSGILDVYPHAKAYALQCELESAEGDYRSLIERNLNTQLERASSVPPRDPPYCVDCTLEFRNKMIAAGRCTYPLTKFRLSVDDDSGTVEIVGDRVEQAA